ncbi:MULTISPECIES: tripartite tricarboxylate transporter substrate binding protein [unclassified Meiothermus]|uniref:Bug family tripartite tricarboxylate transporter substrate binding protein n=1 Tax=unclassified Meiothermus TaxID=370471 RepID=UPI001F1A1BE0|nr:MULTISPECIES: tripartite tricarboxylate transporter substrate-binding protein [unclassified Meiothermus]
MAWIGLLISGLGVAQGFLPRHPECIGGGWDFTCRAVAQLMYQLKIVPQPFTLSHLPGAGGGVAYAHVVSQRDDDPELIVAASTTTAVRLAQGQYGPFNERDVRWLGAIAADFGLVAVKAEAPWKTLQELLAAWKADPSRITTGGPDPLRVALLGRAVGIDPRSIRYTPAEDPTPLKHDLVQIFLGDASVLREEVAGGSLRALGVMAPQRLPGPYTDVPTLRELGYDVDWVVWQGFYMPKSTSAQAYTFWVQALRKVARSPEWAKVREQNGLGEFLSLGVEFQVLVERQVHALRGLSRELGLTK